jgi:hypothetical protein
MQERLLFVGLGVVIVGVIGAVVAGVILAMRMDVGTPTVTAQTTSAEATAKPETTAIETTAADVAKADMPAAVLGEEVRDGDFSITVTGVQRADTVSSPEHPDVEKVAQGEFVLVQLTVTNVGAEPQTYAVSFNTLSDGATRYQSDDEAWLYLGNLPPTLNPGDSVDTVVVFDVPRGTEVRSIELHNGPAASGVMVVL